MRNRYRLVIVIEKYHNIPYYGVVVFFGHSKILRKLCLQFLLGVKMAPRETENNAYAKFWSDQRRVLWYVMVFSGVVKKLNKLFQAFLHLVCKQHPKL